MIRLSDIDEFLQVGVIFFKENYNDNKNMLHYLLNNNFGNRVQAISMVATAFDKLPYNDFNTFFIDISSFKTIESFKSNQKIIIENTKNKPIIYFSSKDCLFSIDENMIGNNYLVAYNKHRVRNFEPTLLMELYHALQFASKMVKVNKLNETKKKLDGVSSAITRKDEATALSVIQTIKSDIEIESKNKELEAKAKPKKDLNIPGFGEESNSLANKLLHRINNSITQSLIAFWIVLGLGVLLVVLSCIMGIINKEWINAVLGSFGIAGIVASLIMNPLKSIDNKAAKIMSINLAYITYLEMLYSYTENANGSNQEEKEKRLISQLESILTITNKNE